MEDRTFQHVLAHYSKLPLAAMQRLVRMAPDVLAYAHGHSVVHKDLKPANLMLNHDGVLKIIDFGMADLLHQQRRSDMVVGTPIYMSLEQIRGEPLDGRTDIYAMPLIAYQLLVGKPPFGEKNLHLERLGKGTDLLPNLRSPLREILEKAAATRREDR